ncbi:MAG: PEP-CTERM sorting domain-containing protein [Candidatus Omnitrophica bacterium]|nr:PEP-CTERM sorting domain-containing protein [Candidatus Omnitrophota bacterium]
MKTKICTLTTLILLSTTVYSYAFYNIDGDLNDWGIDLTDPQAQNKHYLDNHTPIGSNIDFFTEDNTDKFQGSQYVGPGYSNGNRYDAEAIYFDNDAQYAYIAIVTGVSSSENSFPAGDIFLDSIDPTGNQQYHYGIDIITGEFYFVDSWIDVDYSDHQSASPWKIGDNKTLLGQADLFYTTQDINSHYVIEARVPLAWMGIGTSSSTDIWLHWTMRCGNDTVDLKGTVHSTPEPATFFLLLNGFWGFFFLRKK